MHTKTVSDEKLSEPYDDEFISQVINPSTSQTGNNNDSISLMVNLDDDQLNR